MHIIISITLTFFSSVVVVKNVSVHPVLGKTINMVAVDRNCTLATAATRDSCLAARYNNTLDATSVKSSSSVFTANVNGDINIPKTWIVILLRIAQLNLTVKCVIKLSVRNVY